jgi:ABC-type dipeptide/oligopeptide/nickel transport system permease component
MKRTIRLAMGILVTVALGLLAITQLAVGCMALEGVYRWKGVGQGVASIMLSLYAMLIAHAYIITSRIKDLLEEKKEREDTGRN